MLIIVVNTNNIKKKTYFLKTCARGMSKKKGPIVEVDGSEMSVRSEHIARGGRVLEVPQICVRARLRWDGLAFQVLVVQLWGSSLKP